MHFFNVHDKINRPVGAPAGGSNPVITQMALVKSGSQTKPRDAFPDIYIYMVHIKAMPT